MTKRKKKRSDMTQINEKCNNLTKIMIIIKRKNVAKMKKRSEITGPKFSLHLKIKAKREFSAGLGNAQLWVQWVALMLGRQNYLPSVPFWLFGSLSFARSLGCNEMAYPDCLRRWWCCWAQGNDPLGEKPLRNIPLASEPLQLSTASQKLPRTA